ncbi:oligosaccharide flippase family protein [Candidatus Gracilibacteria bacterium]|nr:oligosaccharide flippase family protein [Candidatus Gracilibacteria bacterium]
MYKKLASNTLAQIFSKVVTALIALILISVLTRTLPIEYFGAYNKIYNYFAIVAFLADLGLYTLMIREISAGKSTEKVLGNSLSLRVFLGVIVSIAALLLTLILPGFSSGIIFVASSFIAVFTILSLINSSFLAVMQAHMKIEYHFISFVGGKILHLLLILLFCFWIFSPEPLLDMRFISLFVAGLLSVMFTTYLNYRYVSRIVNVKFLLDFNYIKELFYTSLPYGAALFLSVVYFRIDILLLGFLEEDSLGNISIALYSLPMKIVEVLMVLGVFYLNSLLPRLTELYKKTDILGVQKIFSLSFKILFSFSLALYILSQLFASDIIQILAHSEYLSPTVHNYSSLDIFPLVFGILIFHFLALLYSYLLIASEKQSLLLKVHFFVTLINIVGNIILIPYFSFYGAAIVTLISQVFLLIILLFIVGRHCKITIPLLMQCFYSILLGVFLFYFYTGILTNFPLGVFLQVFIYGTIFAFIYGLGEYLISKKYIKSLI